MEQTVKYKANAFEGRNLIYFFLIAFVWTWLWWWILFFSGWVTVPADLGSRDADLGGGAGFIIILLVVLAPFGPSIGGFVLTALNEGKEGVKKLLEKFWNPKINWKWLLIIFIWWPFLRLATNLFGQVVHGENNPLLVNPDQFWIFIPPLIISTFINGGMSEEFGWRGYALPRLQVKFNALTSAIVLGVIEGLWHYPLILMGQFWLDSIAGLIFWFILTVILRTWIYNNVGGNLLAMMLFHGMGNAQSDIIWCCSKLADNYWVYGTATLLVILIFGPKTLTRVRKS